MSMNLLDAPFERLLRIVGFSLPEDSRLVLLQLGLLPDEIIEKVHSAPLGDPIAIRVGDHVFSLRGEICKAIQVTEAE